MKSYFLKSDRKLTNISLCSLWHFSALVGRRKHWTFLPRRLQTVLPGTDKLHVRSGETPHPQAASLHRLPLAAAHGSGDGDPPVLCCSRTAERSGAAAGPPHSHWAAHQRQGIPTNNVAELTPPNKLCLFLFWSTSGTNTLKFGSDTSKNDGRLVAQRWWSMRASTT